MHFTRAPKQNIHCTSVLSPNFHAIQYTRLHASRHPVPATPDSGASLFDLLLLQLDRLVIDEHTLALVRLRWTPLSNTASKGHEHLLIHALEQDARRLRDCHLDACRNTFFDGMCETQLDAEEFLARERLLAGAALDRGSVSNTDKADDDGVAFGNASYIVVEVRP